MSMSGDEPLEDLLGRVPPEREEAVRRFLERILDEGPGRDPGQEAGRGRSQGEGQGRGQGQDRGRGRGQGLDLGWAGTLSHVDKTGVELEEEALRRWGG